MRPTLSLLLLAATTLGAAASACPIRPATAAGEVLRLSADLERRFFSTDGGEAYLQIDIAAAAEEAARARVPVNAVLILDRSGSMQGEKLERARDAARALVSALGPRDRLSIVEFASQARVALASSPVDPRSRAAALAAIRALFAAGGTNLSAAFDLAAEQLEEGRDRARVDKVFVASDGQANLGVSDRPALLALAARDFGAAAVSTFGIGEDYDEELMNALAAQGGGRARYIASPEGLPAAFRDELSRAASAVARNVRLRIEGASGARILRVLGYEVTGGSVRLPDFAAGEERRVLVKLALPKGQGDTQLASATIRFEDPSGETRELRACARAVFTDDDERLREAAGPAAARGAKAEVAALAAEAARLRESGKDARAQLRSMRAVARRAVAAAGADAPAIAAEEQSYERDVMAVDGARGQASKKLKEKTFDAARAPVAGW